MERYDIYKDIADRTGGDIFIGVVGPVRTGKSTFISNFMEKMVLPNIAGKNRKLIATDEMPQSAEGKTVMTTEPKFVPGESVNVSLKTGANARIRMIDCVGFMVDGVSGLTEEGSPRMVKTPWQDSPMPFEEAAVFGTQKVIKDHSTIGIVITTDGSVTGIDRANYISAEEKVIGELKSINKPFIVVLNCKDPTSSDSQKLKNSLAKKYDVPTVAMSVLNAQEKDFKELLERVLFEFPMRCCRVKIPKWLQALPYESGIISSISTALLQSGEKACKMKDAGMFESAFDGLDKVKVESVEFNLGEGFVDITLSAKSELFYEVLSQECGADIKDEFSLVSYVKSLSQAKVVFDKFKNALPEVEQSGYGIVEPIQSELELEEPQLIKQGGRYGVKLTAKSSGYHIIKVETRAEVTPLSGSKTQCEEYVNYLKGEYEKDEKALWNVNVFGKKFSEMIEGEMQTKSRAMPTDVQAKIKRTVTRIVNEGKGGVICILL